MNVQEVVNNANKNVKVYYDNRYIFSKFEALLMKLCVPAIDVNGSESVIMPDGVTFAGGITQNMIDTYFLMSEQERMRARHIYPTSKCIIYANGGYPNSQPQAVGPFPAYIVSLPAPSFENKRLEFSFLTSNYNGDYRLTDNVYLKKDLYRQVLYDDFVCLIHICNEIARTENNNVTLRLPALGMGFFANINGSNASDKLIPFYLEALTEAIKKYAAPSLISLQLPDYTSGVIYNITGPLNHVRVVNQRYLDLLFSD